MSREIVIYGNSSQKVIKRLIVKHDDLTKKVMDFLYENNIPIASSCYGEGICQKCIVNDTIISCTLTIQAFLTMDKHKQIINISYL